MASRNSLNHTIYKVVLTGGPCGGKTTGQDRLSTFFEQLGWKVFRVPEAATILLNGGVKFNELSAADAFRFQENLLMTMMQMEKTFMHLAETFHKDVLIIFDRGTMDPSAYIDDQGWNLILQRNGLNEIDIRDNRYNQVVHLTTAADGAEGFYTLTNNTARSEGLADAINTDRNTRNAWVGHPYFDVVDNSKTKSFEDKMKKLIQIVCDRIGVDYGDRLEPNATKRKWLVTGIDESRIPEVRQQFDVIHDYLMSASPDVQTRIRKRGQNDRWSYTSTVRRNVNGAFVETKLALNKREYEQMRANRDCRRCTTLKQRMCFNYEGTYWQLDIYKHPLPPGSPTPDSLMLLETYTTKHGADIILPPFLKVQEEVTGRKEYSMFTLSARPCKPVTQFADINSTTHNNGVPASPTNSPRVPLNNLML